MKREYTQAEMIRWATAAADGVDGAAFRARFGLITETARRIAARAGIVVPHIDRGTGIGKAKSPGPVVLARRDRKRVGG